MKSIMKALLPMLAIMLTPELNTANAEETMAKETASAMTDPAQIVPLPQAAPLKAGYAWVFRQTGAHDNTPFTVFAQFNVLYKNKEGGFAIERERGEAGRVITWDNQYAHKAWFVVGQPICLLDIVGQGSLFGTQPCPTQPAVGDTWTAEDIYPEPHTAYQFKVIGAEEVQVPAGRFQTVKIVSEPKNHDAQALKKRLTTYWYAPELQIIVKAVREFSGDPDIAVGTTTDELETHGIYDAGLRKRIQQMQGDD